MRFSRRTPSGPRRSAGFVTSAISIAAHHRKTLLIIASTLFFASVVVVHSGSTQSKTSFGVIEAIAELFVKLGGNSVLLMYAMIVGVSVLLSAFIDNIPYVATMLPVVSGIASLLGVKPYLFAFGLLIGATLGGNITPVGASANIAAVGMLKKQGETVSFGDFMRIGVPFTLVAVLTGYVYLWVFWS